MKLNTFDTVPEIDKPFVLYWKARNKWAAEERPHALRKGGLYIDDLAIDVAASPDFDFATYIRQIETNQIAWLSYTWVKSDERRGMHIERHKKFGDRWVYCGDVIKALKGGLIVDYRRLEVAAS